MGLLEGKVACITGGTRGIGRATAEAFVREGAKVVINGRSADKGAQALAEMNAGDAVHFIAADVKTREGCEAVVNGTVDHFGSIDIMFANAGGASNHAPIVDLTDEAMQDSLVWNFWHTFWTMQTSFKYMIPQGSGRFIAMSSVEGKVGKPAISIYVAAKHAINGLVKSAAQEVGPHGITVNSVCPGAIETDIMQTEGPPAAEAMGMTYEQLLDVFASESAIKRLNEVSDVAEVLVLMASEAGGGISGSLISIDGRVSALLGAADKGVHMGKLEGKVACITGGTRSIGRGIAEAFLAEGAKVVVNGRNADKGATAVAEMGGGDNISFYAGDVSQQDVVEGLVDHTIERYGQLDICCLNSGGVLATAPVAQMSDEEWELEINWNLNHVFWGMRRSLQHMIPRESGRVIVTGSIEGKLGKPGIPGYAATKHAVNGLVKAAAHEVGTLGITVNAILPGLIETDIVQATGPASAEAMGLDGYDALLGIFAEQSAIKRLNRVEEVAAVAVLLASDAARNMTGVLFPVDGGTMPY